MCLYRRLTVGNAGLQQAAGLAWLPMGTDRLPSLTSRLGPTSKEQKASPGPESQAPLQTVSSQNPRTPESDNNAPFPRSLTFTPPPPSALPPSLGMVLAARWLNRLPLWEVSEGRRGEDGCLLDVPTP